MNFGHYSIITKKDAETLLKIQQLFIVFQAL